jgi:hypothetical protein
VNDSYNGTGLVTGLDIRRQNLVTESASLRWEMSRRFALQLNGSHEVRDTDISIYNFTDDRVGLEFSASI